MQIQLFIFSKRENSTARPASGVETLTTDVQLRADACSILSPVIRLQGIDEPARYNYAYIPAWHRYYWINDWTAVSSLWFASLRVDPLATWRDDIALAREYVLRSAAEYDPTLTDTLYPATGSTDTAVSTAPAPWTQKYATGGTYIVGIIGKPGAAGGYGGINYRALDVQGMAALRESLMASTDWLGSDFGDIAADAIKAIVNPMQYITSIMWYPFAVGQPQPVPRSTPIGWYPLTVQDHVMREPEMEFTFDLRIPKHPQQTRGSYLNAAPYARYHAILGPWGDVAIDPMLLHDAAYLHARIHVDLLTGLGVLWLSTDTDPDAVIYAQPAMIGVQTQLSQITHDVLGGALATASTVANAATGSVLGAASGIMSAASALAPRLTSKGAQGSTIQFAEPPKLLAEFLHVVPDDNEHRGRPLCAIRRVSELPGYIRVADADLHLPATAEENASVKAAMEGGFYFE